jgi:hypothetical protein
MASRTVLVAFAIVCGGCASPTLTPIPSTGQAVEYHNGRPTIVSVKTNVVITGLITNEVDDHAILYIGALNKSANTVTLGTENVSASSGSRALTVFTYEKLVRHARVGATWQRVGLAMSAGARAGAAAQPSTTNVQGSVYGPYGGQANYSGTAVTYDPAATAVAQSAINADTREQAAEINAQTSARMSQLSGILRTTTVHPGQFAGGVVEINNRGMKDTVNLQVDFAGETHRFAFRLKH